jgi:hypothetical protein
LKIKQVKLFPCTYKATVDLIGKCYDRLEHFEIELRDEKSKAGEKFEEYLKESDPTIHFSSDRLGYYIFSK